MRERRLRAVPRRRVVRPRIDLAFWTVPKKYREVRSALEAAGWQVLRRRGSHEVWGKPGESGRIVAAGKDSEYRPGRNAL